MYKLNVGIVFFCCVGALALASSFEYCGSTKHPGHSVMSRDESNYLIYLDDQNNIPIDIFILRENGLPIINEEFAIDLIQTGSNLLYDEKNSKDWRFKVHSVSYIDDESYLEIDSDERYSMIQAHRKFGSVNVFFVKSERNWFSQVCAKSSFVQDRDQGITFSTTADVNYKQQYGVVCLGDIDKPHYAIVAHEFGHYFGLLHTHTSWGSSEFGELVSREDGQCKIKGDFLCETQASSLLSLNNMDLQTCSYIGVLDERGDRVFEKDRIGQPIHPQTDNFMSYGVGYCKESFVQEQLDVMHEGKQFRIKSPHTEFYNQVDVQVQLMPNPATIHQSIRVQFKTTFLLQKDVSFALGVYDLHGRLIYKALNGNQLHIDPSRTSGQVLIPADTLSTFNPSQASGMYFVKLILKIKGSKGWIETKPAKLVLK